MDVRAVVDERPQALSTQPGERVLDVDGAAQRDDVGPGVRALDARPAGVGGPGVVEVGGGGAEGGLEFHRSGD